MLTLLNCYVIEKKLFHLKGEMLYNRYCSRLLGLRMCSYTCYSDVQIKRQVSCVYSVFTCVHDTYDRLQHLATRMGYSIEVLQSSWRF